MQLSTGVADLSDMHSLSKADVPECTYASQTGLQADSCRLCDVLHAARQSRMSMSGNYRLLQTATPT